MGGSGGGPNPSTTVWRRQIGFHPSDLSWRAGLLFMVGSSAFALGSLPPYFSNVSAATVGVTFFTGSLFFTSAGITQLQQVVAGGDSFWQPRNAGWSASVVQLIGMLFFNANTFRAAFLDVASSEVNRLVWAPDFFGSVAFLVASHIVWWSICQRWWCAERERSDWWIAALNYLGSIFFMLAALAAFVLPTTDEPINIAIVNAGTFLGAVCFFLGAYLLLPQPRAKTRSSAI